MRDGSLRQAVLERDVPMLLYEGGEALRFECPLPDDLQHLLQLLREEDPADVGARSLD